jgi:hydrogenase-4 component F
MNLILVLILPLLASACAFITRNKHVASIATFISCLLLAALAVGDALGIVRGTAVVALPGWLALDGLSALVLLAVGWSALISSLFSIGYIEHHYGHDSRRVCSYYGHFNLFVFALAAVPVIVEPNLDWIAVEFTAVFGVLLVSFENTHEALEAAWKYIVLMFMGAAIALLGFLVLYWAAHRAGATTYTWQGLRAMGTTLSPELTRMAFLLILVGFGTKTGLVPMHTWLPDAHSQAPSPVCALLSGVKTTVCMYPILRLVPLLSPDTANRWFLVFGLLSVGVAGFLLLGVRDYKRMFAFSTVEHMGIIFTAVGLGVPATRFAAMAQILTHSVTKSFCFLVAGAMVMVLKTRDIASVRGLAKTSPFITAALFIGSFAIAGAPPFAVFISEFSIFKGGYQAGHYTLTSLLVFLIVVAFFGLIYQVSRMTFGKPAEEPKPFHLPGTCRLSLILGVLPIIILGVYWPQPLHDLLQLAANQLEPTP